MKKLLISIILATVAGFGLFLSPAKAADDESPAPSTWIQIAPVTNRLKLSPGQKYDGSVKVTNVGAANFDFKVYATSYGVTDLDYEPIFDTETAYSHLAKWVSFGQTEYKNLAPNQSIEVPYSISVPENTPGGGQYAVIFAETLAEPSQEQTASASITTVSRVGSLVFADLGGESNPAGEILAFEQPGWSESSIKSETVVKNTGNIDFAAHKSFVVKTLFGREIFSETLDKSVLPETSRLLAQEWKDTPAAGIFSVTNTVNFLNGDQVSETKLVIVGPLWLIIGVSVILLLILILVVLIIVKKVKKSKNKKVSKTNQKTKKQNS